MKSSYGMLIVVSIFVLVISLLTLSYKPAKSETTTKENFTPNDSSSPAPGPVKGTTVTSTPAPAAVAPPPIDLSDMRQQLQQLEKVSNTPTPQMKDVDVAALQQIIGSSNAATFSERDVPPPAQYGSSENVKGSGMKPIDFSYLTSKKSVPVQESTAVKESFVPMAQPTKYQAANW